MWKRYDCTHSCHNTRNNWKCDVTRTTRQHSAECLPPVLFSALLLLLLWNVIAFFPHLCDLSRYNTAVCLALEKPLKVPELVCFNRAHRPVCLALAWRSYSHCCDIVAPPPCADMPLIALGGLKVWLGPWGALPHRFNPINNPVRGSQARSQRLFTLIFVSQPLSLSRSAVCTCARTRARRHSAGLELRWKGRVCAMINLSH